MGKNPCVICSRERVVFFCLWGKGNPINRDPRESFGSFRRPRERERLRRKEEERERER